MLADRLRVLLAEDDTVAVLDELYVAPHLRGQGIGSTVISTLMELALDLAVELIEINVDEGDVEAQRFSHRHGFTSIEPDTGERAVYFHRELDSPQR